METPQATTQTRAPEDDPASRAPRSSWAALEAGKHAEAEVHLNEAAARNQKDAEAIAGFGVLRMRLARPAEAADLLQRAGAMYRARRVKSYGLS